MFTASVSFAARTGCDCVAVRRAIHRYDATVIDESVSPLDVSDADDDAGAPRSFVVCGDNALALRLVEELVDRYGAEVSVVVPAAATGQAPAMARRSGVRLVESERVDVDALSRAGVSEAEAVALVAQDDVGNVDSALLIRELTTEVPIVARIFNPVLGDGLQRLIDNCVILSDAAMAAPAFVVAAVSDLPTFVALPGRILHVVSRDTVEPSDVVCGLAVTAGRPVPETLPADEERADLVLASNDHERAIRPARRYRRRRARTVVRAMWRRLRYALAGLVAVLVAATLTIAVLTKLGWWQSTYVTVLSALAGANPDLRAPTALQIVEGLLTLVSVAVIPVLTAAVVEGGVDARLALASGGPTEPMSGHVVVVGLGNVGTRVIRALHDSGVEVVAVDVNEHAPGVAVARDAGIPLIIGDSNNETTLRAAGVQTCRALMVLTTDDVVNLEAALIGQAVRPGLRVVLRLFDGAFAERLGRAFGIQSRSVSYLAAPAFAAAMLGRAVIGTIPVGRRVLLVADLPVGPASDLEYLPVSEVSRPHEVRLLGVRTGRGDQVLWSPPSGRKLARTDRLVVVATRAGLSRLVARLAPGQNPPQPFE
jgi:Trk K+ transport system NAD-binding subunit